jgi:hypothetical protein
MTDGIDEEDFKKLAYEVHPVAESEVKGLLSSLDEEWSPFIPKVLRNDSIFTRRGYRVGNTFVPDVLEVSLRVHKIVEHDALGMLTVLTHEKNESIRVDCFYTTALPNGFKSWSEIGGERKGNPVLIESRTVEYSTPDNGNNHSDEEVEEIVKNVVREIRNLTEEYNHITQEEVAECYEDVTQSDVLE